MTHKKSLEHIAIAFSTAFLKSVSRRNWLNQES